MAELDIAMLAIFMLGAFGVHIEPWSPHPPLMVGAGLLYFGARLAVPIVARKLSLYFRRYRNGQKENRNKNLDGNRICRMRHRRSGDRR